MKNDFYLGFVIDVLDEDHANVIYTYLNRFVQFNMDNQRRIIEELEECLKRSGKISGKVQTELALNAKIHVENGL